jgi:glyoxylase-like metal-dependent hydrolase (beta-lactamase superfamily II)
MIKDQSNTKNNVYLIVDKETNHTAIVDPACKMEQINNAVKQFGLILKTVLITHTHLDHIRSVDSIENCSIYS